MIPAEVFHLLHLISLTPTLGIAILWIREREQAQANTPTRPRAIDS